MCRDVHSADTLWVYSFGNITMIGYIDCLTEVREAKPRLTVFGNDSANVSELTIGEHLDFVGCHSPALPLAICYIQCVVFQLFCENTGNLVVNSVDVRAEILVVVLHGVLVRTLFGILVLQPVERNP